ncbi:peptidase M16 [Roseibium aquae]|uniref:Peptidase M16 n=1 Tax=Roseibium aquae TaxID=1323746 RepID=A0A916TKF2_9HYPH|nr:pitrilysin family protein [Roseibium aquae]GGB52608.1 peptidase M16 [Roseibium aquae]
MPNFPQTRKQLRAAAIGGLLAAGLFAGTATASETPKPPESLAALEFAPGLSHHTLDNGLQIVVIPDRRAPVVTHMIWYKAGSADELPGQSGIAHFLEHLMFKGTENNPDGAFSKTVAEIGGQENAFTSLDFTAYFQRVSKEHLPTMMEMEADRMQNLVLNDEVVAPERDVVLEERRQRVDSSPSSRLHEMMNAITFVNHPYGSPVIGWESEIEALGREEAFAFYDRFYTPNNAILVVAGDIDAEQVVALAEQTYGQVPRRAEPGTRVRPAEPPLQGVRRAELEDPRVRQESLSMIWIVPSSATGDPGTAEALDVVSYALGGSTNSALYKALVLDQKLAINAGSYYQSSALNDGRFGVYATPRPGVSLETLEAAIETVLAEFLDTGISAETLARAQRNMIADAVYAQDSQTTLARIFGSALTTGSTIEDVKTWPQRIMAVSEGDVLDAANTYLGPTKVIGYLRMPSDTTGDAAASSPSATSDERT